MDPYHRSTLFFGSRHQGLWRSDDGAAHWARVTSFPRPGLGLPTARRQTHGGLSFVLFDPARPGRVVVGSADGGSPSLFRSDDGGRHWRAVPGGPAADLLPVKAVIGRDGVLTITYANGIGPNGITRGAVWRHDLERGRWTDVTPDRSPDAPAGGYMGVAVSARDPRIIAVSTVDRYHPVDTVWRSTDAGAHWDELWRRSSRDVSATPFLKLDGSEANFGHWIAGLAIDPFDDTHAAYVTGATLYATSGFAAAGPMRWQPWTEGIEQTAIITAISPTGGAPLVSGFGDIAGFRHADLSSSPAHLHRDPFLSNTNNLDYAGLAPAIMVRSGSTHERIVDGPTLAWSADGGESWQPLTPPAISSPTPFPGPSPVRTGDAPIVVSADGRTFLAATVMPLLTRDRGDHWQAVAGLPVRTRVTADKVDPAHFYAVDAARSGLVRSDDGGAHFHPVAARGLPADLGSAAPPSREAQNPLVAVPGRAGSLWLLVDRALYRSTDYGEHWTRAPGPLRPTQFGLGKAAPGAFWPALYAIAGTGPSSALWRSLDGGTRWARISDERHRWGSRFRFIIGDPRRFGRVYVGTDGRGILYGDAR
ncbi:hypothetical protein HMF7854_12245 [Sphingomonas ginkgonis]|uniref:Exo-alpha-sialidase n=1 Tax=Sphingomonas ginkgonis TaxID=2315330 RepID=A0A429VE84_9SPHN|nr:hypothetical protein HMF7854_12245 [Sphingomonas ginkgonis]